MATEFINQATSSATVAGQTVNFQSNLITSQLFDINSVTLVKSQSTPLVASGGKITYTVVVTNLTLVPVANFDFSDVIPTGMSYATGTFKVNTVSQTPTVTGQTLTYQISSLAVGITTITFDCDVA